MLLLVVLPSSPLSRLLLFIWLPFLLHDKKKDAPHTSAVRPIVPVCPQLLTTNWMRVFTPSRPLHPWTGHMLYGADAD